MPATTKKPLNNSDNKIIALLSYIGLLVLIPLLTKKDDEFVQFHAKQGLVLLIATIIVNIIKIIPILGQIIFLFGGLGCLVLTFIGIVNVLNGQKKQLPLIGQFSDKFNI
ncbi:MAG: Uncharacterized protein XD98_0239 [Microgenomates bacterium 39_6]|nr:MAG: Uncharacterized protein XD98_0239 [Microgenomates bacterium 39_6]